MDTSPEYILQCDKAEEIQNYKGSLNEGDFYAFRDYGSFRTMIYPMLPLEPPYKAKIWLPRQDQLQEMMFAHWNLNYTLRLLHEFVRWVDIGGYGRYENLSMEQLWLAFAMKEKYNKVWDREEWIVGKK